MADADTVGARPAGRLAGAAGQLRWSHGQGGDHLPSHQHPSAGRRVGPDASGGVCMSTPLTVECRVAFRRLVKGRKQMQKAPAAPRPLVPPGRVPRVSRWMALAIRFEHLLREGHVASYAELARLGHVTPARISQIMNLLYLAPDVQEF